MELFDFGDDARQSGRIGARFDRLKFKIFKILFISFIYLIFTR